MRKVIIGFALILVILAIGGCVSTECTRAGQVFWDKDFHPDKDAPKWTKNLKEAAKEAGVSLRRIPEKTIVLIGASEDLNNKKGSYASALDNMLQQYAGYLKEDLDGFMRQALENLGMSTLNIDTAVGASNAVCYIPNQAYESDLVKTSWQATGRRCLESGEEPVYRVYVLGVIEKEDRKAHLPVAAKETFKYAVIRKDKKDKIMKELEKLISKS
ncbi:MAG: hypothetical protein GH155_01425 [Spirochaeta sp.]|nr:hypothetical protein [Spirochaeta sp.]